jgi:hypothetical protein
VEALRGAAGGSGSRIAVPLTRLVLFHRLTTTEGRCSAGGLGNAARFAPGNSNRAGLSFEELAIPAAVHPGPSFR